MNKRDRFVICCMFQVIITGFYMILSREIADGWLEMMKNEMGNIYQWADWPEDARLV